MIDLHNAKLQKTNVNFAPLISYTPGKLGDLSNSGRREKLANSLAEYIEGAIKSFDHPIFQQEEKMALYEAVLKIQNEFNGHKDGARLKPTAKALRKALSIPEPKSFFTPVVSKENESVLQKLWWSLWLFRKAKNS
jgi:hypothetical protein